MEKDQIGLTLFTRPISFTSDAMKVKQNSPSIRTNDYDGNRKIENFWGSYTAVYPQREQNESRNRKGEANNSVSALRGYHETLPRKTLDIPENGRKETSHEVINLLTLFNDSHQISPYNVATESHIKVEDKDHQLKRLLMLKKKKFSLSAL